MLRVEALVWLVCLVLTEVHNFRFGAWVERLRIHAEQLVKAKELAEKQKVESENAEKLKPFGDVDF